MGTKINLNDTSALSDEQVLQVEQALIATYTYQGSDRLQWPADWPRQISGKSDADSLAVMLGLSKAVYPKLAIEIGDDGKVVIYNDGGDEPAPAEQEPAPSLPVDPPVDEQHEEEPPVVLPPTA